MRVVGRRRTVKTRTKMRMTRRRSVMAAGRATGPVELTQVRRVLIVVSNGLSIEMGSQVVNRPGVARDVLLITSLLMNY